MRFYLKVLVFAVGWILAAAISAFGQSPLADNAPAKPDMRPAQALYEEANGYLEKKFEEFNQKKLPYDPKLEATTKQKQKDLIARNTATLEARGSLAGTDLYYLGMLYH